MVLEGRPAAVEDLAVEEADSGVYGAVRETSRTSHGDDDVYDGLFGLSDLCCLRDVSSHPSYYLC